MDYCGKIAIRSSRQHRTTLPIVEFKCNKMQPTSYNQLWSYIQKVSQLFPKKSTRLKAVCYTVVVHNLNPQIKTIYFIVDVTTNFVEKFKAHFEQKLWY